MIALYLVGRCLRLFIPGRTEQPRYSSFLTTKHYFLKLVEQMEGEENVDRKSSECELTCSVLLQGKICVSGKKTFMGCFVVCI